MMSAVYMQQLTRNSAIIAIKFLLKKRCNKEYSEFFLRPKNRNRLKSHGLLIQRGGIMKKLFISITALFLTVGSVAYAQGGGGGGGAGGGAAGGGGMGGTSGGTTGGAGSMGNTSGNSSSPGSLGGGAGSMGTQSGTYSSGTSTSNSTNEGNRAANSRANPTLPGQPGNPQTGPIRR